MKSKAEQWLVECSTRKYSEGCESDYDIVGPWEEVTDE